MMNGLIDAFDKTVQYFCSNSFASGYFTGLAFFAVCLLLLCLFWLVIRPHRVSQIVIVNERGQVSISSAAVSDLVKTLENSFANIVIRRVSVMKRHSKLDLEIQLDYAKGEVSLQDTIKKLQNDALGLLSRTFGITNISAVRVKVRRTLPDAV